MENGEKDPKQIAREILNKSSQDDYEGRVKGARVVLIVLGILNIIVGLFYYFGRNLEIEGYLSIAIGAIFVALFFVGIKKPMLALIIGLTIYAGIIILSAVVEPESLVNGIILKIIIVGLLIRGIISVGSLPKQKPDTDSELIDDF